MRSVIITKNKQMKKYIGILGAIIIGSAIFAGTFYTQVERLVVNTDSLGGPVTSQFYDKIKSSSTAVVGVQENKTLFAENFFCANRVITTREQPIMLSFSSDITPSAVVGHQQSASTTISYLGSEYGCGAITAYGANASTTITISEFNY